MSPLVVKWQMNGNYARKIHVEVLTFGNHISATPAVTQKLANICLFRAPLQHKNDGFHHDLEAYEDQFSSSLMFWTFILL